MCDSTILEATSVSRKYPTSTQQPCTPAVVVGFPSLGMIPPGHVMPTTTQALNFESRLAFLVGDITLSQSFIGTCVYPGEGDKGKQFRQSPFVLPSPPGGPLPPLEDERCPPRPQVVFCARFAHRTKAGCRVLNHARTASAVTVKMTPFSVFITRTPYPMLFLPSLITMVHPQAGLQPGEPAPRPSPGQSCTVSPFKT